MSHRARIAAGREDLRCSAALAPHYTGVIASMGPQGWLAARGNASQGLDAEVRAAWAGRCTGTGDVGRGAIRPGRRTCSWNGGVRAVGPGYRASPWNGGTRAVGPGCYTGPWNGGSGAVGPGYRTGAWNGGFGAVWAGYRARAPVWVEARGRRVSRDDRRRDDCGSRSTSENDRCQRDLF